MAAGDIISVTVLPTGWEAEVKVSGLAVGGTYAFGMGSNNNPATGTPKVDFTVVSLGYDNTGAATTITRHVYGVPAILAGGAERWPYSTASIAGVFTSGTFVDGETVTASISGRTAIVLGAQATGPNLWVRTVSGATNAADVWTGGTSSAIFTASATASATTTQTATAAPARERYDGTNTTIRFALSDYIYQKDATGAGNSGTAPVVSVLSGLYTSSGTPTNASGAGFAVTNSSTIAYPKVIGHFAVAQRLALNGPEAIEVFAVHKYGTGGNPIAFLTMTATGGSSGHTETGTATAMTLSARGDLIPVYVVSLNLSVGAGFTRGELVSIRFTAYPWMGDSTAVLDSTTDAGTKPFQLTDLKRTIMDKMICRVSATGNDSTGVASTNQATADASPCLTWQGAALKIAAQNNTSFSLNRLDGGEIQLNAGTYRWNKTGSSASTNGVFTLCPHSSTNRAGVIWDANVADTHTQYAYQRFYNCTITRANNTYIIFAAGTNVLIMDTINMTDAQTNPWYSGDTDTNVEFFDCTSTNGNLSKGGNDGHARIVRNYTYTATTPGAGSPCGNASCVLGFHGQGGAVGMWVALASQGSNNFVHGYCTHYALTDGLWVSQSNLNMTNWAIVNNVVERIVANATPLIEISATNITNLLIVHNSFPGQRFNMENDWATPTNKVAIDYVGKFNSFNARGNHRADIRAANGSIIGYWPVDNSVGWDSNHDEGIAATGDFDFHGLNSNFTAGNTGIQTPVPAGYVSDQSQGGTGTGNGNYHVAAGSVLIGKITNNKSILPYDISGTPRTAVDAAGAYHYGLGGDMFLCM